MRQLVITQQITTRESDSFNKYLQEVSKIDIIGADDEAMLAAEIKEGNVDAMEKLIKANLRFVISVAKQYQSQGMSLNDLINEGNMGLIKAAQRFDATKGFKFISYAVWWIRQMIIKAIEEHSKIVRLPSNKISMINKIKKTFARLEQEYEREPSADELAEVMGIIPEEVDEYMKYSGKHVSLDKENDDGENSGGTMMNMLENPDSIAADSMLMDASMKLDIQRVLAKLSKREETIVSMYFGLDGTKYKSLEEIGFKLEISKERVRQIKDTAIRKMRMVARKTALRSYLM